MKAGNWKFTIELIGIGAIVASLVFVGLQLQQEQQIAVVDTFGAVAEAGMNLSTQVGENMEIWQKALEGDELTTEEYGVFIGLFNAVMIHYQQNFVRLSMLGSFDPGATASEFAYALYIFPGMKSAFEEVTENRRAKQEARNLARIAGQFETIIVSSLAKYEEEKPPLPDPKLYVFWSF
jgi:hypothetical protein